MFVDLFSDEIPTNFYKSKNPVTIRIIGNHYSTQIFNDTIKFHQHYKNRHTSLLNKA